MKIIQVRHSVFETNSSSTHSLTMCLKFDYEAWKQGAVYLNNGGGWGSYSNKAEVLFVTREDIIEILTNNKYPTDTDLSALTDNDFDDWLRDNASGFQRFDDHGDDYETFKKEFTTPSGDVVVAFGYYGMS